MYASIITLFLSIGIITYNTGDIILNLLQHPVPSVQYSWGNSQGNKNKDKHKNDDDDYYGGDDDDDHYSNDDDDDNSNEIPLDGGLSVLAVAGVGLGIKKVRDVRAKKKHESK